MNCLIAVVGPTAIGKSRLGSLIAKDFPAEIINADSRQIYKYMDIGTSKPTSEERTVIPYHLLDIITPDQEYSVAAYQREAGIAIGDIQSRDKLPLLVGGSGQYVWSLIEGWQIPEVPPDPSLRESLANKASVKGIESLYIELKAIDPIAATRISPHNLRRIIRALEIHYKTGRKPSELQGKKETGYQYLIIGLTAERKVLYSIIDDRVEKMIGAGLVDEVKNLLDRGYGPWLPSMSSLGYREIATYLKGGITLSDAIEKIKFGTHRFARGQYAWFRLSDPRIVWFDICCDNREKINYTIKTFLEKSS